MQERSLRQVHSHGDDRFPLSIYPVDYTGDHVEILPCHWHDEFEIVYVVRGQGRFWIDGRAVQAGAGSALFVHSRELHSGESVGDEGCAYYAIVFRGVFLASAVMDACQSDYINPLLSKMCVLPIMIQVEDPEMAPLMALIEGVVARFFERTVGFELEIKGALLTLIGALVRLNTLRRPAPLPGEIGRQEDIQTVLSYLEEHYAEEIHIEQVAELVHMSRFHFCRLFKAYTGLSMVEFLNRYRVHRACELLEKVDTVMEAAIQSGYGNMSYFTLTFKRYIGMTPSEFKRRQYSPEETRALSRTMVGGPGGG